MTADGAAADPLSVAEELYDRGLYLQAFREFERLGPIREVRGLAPRILAGRLANNLGHRQLGRVLHLLAWREEKAPVSALYHSYGLVERYGPLAALDHLASWCDRASDHPEIHAHMLAARAHAAAMLRDFDRASQWIESARELRPDDPWVLTECSDCLEEEDRYTEALELVQQALRAMPWYRPAVQQNAHLLRLLDRQQDAIEFLEEAARQLESGAIIVQLASLHEECADYAAARHWYERLPDFSPRWDSNAEKWLSANRAHLAYRQGAESEAIEHAESLGDEYHRGFVERLRTADFPRRRVLLDVGFVRQHHLTCAPATLTALSRYWNKPVEHLELSEAICYDGTPAHSERHWAETHGWHVREFTVTLEGAQALLDRGLPFTLTTTETTNSHLQAVIGYDTVRQSLLIRDPFIYAVREFLAAETLQRYRATGPRGMLLVPMDETVRLDGIVLQDAELYDRLYEVLHALSRHDRPKADTALAQLIETAPGHRITLTARRSIACYDANTPAHGEVLKELREQFPDDGHLQFAQLSCMQQLAPRAERLDLLRQISGNRNADPAFTLQLASELRAEARTLDEAEWCARRAFRRNPLSPQALATIANILDLKGQQERAVELYRLAACSGDVTESFSQSFFSAARRVRRTAEALSFLRQRRTRFGSKSVQPALTLFQALRIINRTTEAFALLEEEIAARPVDPGLLTFAADAYARVGRLADADTMLARAEPVAQRTDWLKTAARLHTYRGASREALQCWEEILELEPLSIEAHTASTDLRSALEGREAAVAKLRQACEQMPCNVALQRLLCSWLRESPASEHEAGIRRLLELHASDVWAFRELAHSLSRQGRKEEAVAAATAAIEAAPNDPWCYVSQATNLRAVGAIPAARAACEKAIRLSVDTGAAIDILMACCTGLEEQKAALRLVEEELQKQVVFGEGLTKFRDAAAGILAPAELETTLRSAYSARPDLPAAWSALIIHLLSARRPDEAWDFANEATQRFPLEVSIWLDAANVQRARLQTEGEAAALDQALRLDPGNGEVVRMRAALHSRCGDFESAQQVMAQACSLSPLDAVNFGWLAEMLWKLGRKEEALANLRRALQLNANYDWAWNVLNSWAEALQQPDLPQTLARELIARLPGEAHPWFVLARLIDATKHSDERLAAFDNALRLNPRHIGAHYLKARTLARVGRFDDALIACRGDAWAGEKAPVELRLCAAQIEAARGNRRQAIAQTREITADHPAFYDAWQSLAGWLWEDGQREAAVEATQHLGQLAPLSAVPFGYLGSLQSELGKKAEAKAAFRKAFELDPTYDFGGFRLFDLQLEDKEFADATRTLSRLQKHISGPWPYVSAIRLGLVHPAAADPLEAFRQLANLPGETREALEAGYDAIAKCRQISELSAFLDQMVQRKESNPAVGYIWGKRKARYAISKFPKKPLQFFGTEAIAQQAVIAWLEIMGEQKLRNKVLPFISRHRKWLMASTQTWALAGYALVTANHHKRAIAWMSDWQRRPDVAPWMLSNLIAAFRSLSRYAEAQVVSKAALAIPQQDDTHPRLRLWFASEEAFAGRTESAAMHLAEVQTNGFNVLQKLVYEVASSVVVVQRAASPDRRSVFRQQIARLYAVSTPNPLTKMTPDYRRAFRRGMRKMASDSGLWLPYWSCWLKCFPWSKVALVGIAIPALVILAGAVIAIAPSSVGVIAMFVVIALRAATKNK